MSGNVTLLTLEIGKLGNWEIVC